LRVLHAAIVDNSLHFVKNFSRFVLKGLATHVYNSPILGGFAIGFVSGIRFAMWGDLKFWKL
jgi:hypothetical protein